MDREFDIVLYGATGFVGRFATKYLQDHAPKSLRWAIAGRDDKKLAALNAGVPRVVADSNDPASVLAMCERARCVLSVVGPYAKYGDPIVDGCVSAGTDYVDITGETAWVADVIARHHETAQSKRIRMVPCAGFDSIPSELGSFVVGNAARARSGSPVSKVLTSFRLRGGLNGGTLDSALTMAETGTWKRMADPQLLVPADLRHTSVRKGDKRAIVWNADRECFLVPFYMAQTNGHIVRRGHALMGADSYANTLYYEERQEAKNRWKATTTVAGMGIAVAALQTGAGRSLARRMLPKPGEGPSAEVLAKGAFRVRITAECEDGTKVQGVFADDHADPGNKATAKMVCETAMALVLDTDRLSQRFGVITAVSACGEVLAERLRKAGMEIWAE